ncbi:Sugar phosphate isomerase/epimerase [Abditibacterium utsteinense]|uniref:Sugar phosphate isomerase/epimerase n=1 Tax=Abditibacterium utsteinense TaxID=1960156 RepID=A0A2S8SVL6_9BACT|nr:sugar phosphate isomerase/epimerase [Abditibacterium utsteinense]PQV64840.1 Sugar phosphate isomerase/epimerase [Abditibacterium utsteinense]
MNWTLSAFADEAAPSCNAQIAALARAGLKRLDLRSIDGHNISDLPSDVARKVKNSLDDSRVTVQMLGSPLGKIDIAEDFNADLQKLRHIGEVAQILGCQAVRIFSYYNAHSVSHAEWMAKSLARLEQLRDEAKNLGLVLFHENERHIFGDLGDDVLQIAALRDANFQLIFDFDNYNQSQEDVWQTWQKLADVTDSFHIKDSTSENQHVPAGQGSGQIPAILADAVKRGWSGPLSVEPHLSHSGAVAATGPSGAQNETFSAMPTQESFHIAVEAAKAVLQNAGARWE